MRIVTQRLLAAGLIGCVLPFSLAAQDSSELTPQTSRMGKYAVVPLTADLRQLSENQRRMISLLIDAAQRMDEIFWQQAYGDRESLLAGIADAELRRFAQVNYGPWDRLADNQPFVPGFESKPSGANFYPRDMSRQELESYLAANPEQAEALTSQYTMVRRDAAGKLQAIPYHQEFERQTRQAADRLEQAAELADDPGLRAYLLARAEALRTDDYRHSDMLWMDMKDNQIDVVVGPIENYEDQLFGYKTAHTCYVLVKDMPWSKRLAKYAGMLPALQRGLPVEERYRREEPGSNADLNAYDVVYYAGDCNAGSKTIAINLPNDEQVQLQKGSRRLQLKNAMRAKFDTILVPLAQVLIAEDQQPHITFDAFFGNTMFHEVAHGLGIKYVIDGSGTTVREALREAYSALEEGKADILGLYMITQLWEQGELSEGDLMDYYVTFMASVFRSVRFGASSAHGQANMIRFNFFEQQGAFTRQDNGRYRIHPDKMRAAMTRLSQQILQLQGDGDYGAARRYVDQMAYLSPTLEADLQRLNRQGIPVDIIFQQGVEVLGLRNPSR